MSVEQKACHYFMRLPQLSRFWATRASTCGPVERRASVHSLDHGRHTLAAPDAKCREPYLAIFGPERMHKGSHQASPVIPYGCPRARAPPRMLSRSSSTPSCARTGITWAANASFISTRSRSPITILARRSASTRCLNGAKAHDLRIDPGPPRGNDAQGENGEPHSTLVADDDRSDSAVVQRARVAGDHLSARAKHRLELARRSRLVSDGARHHGSRALHRASSRGRPRRRNIRPPRRRSPGGASGARTRRSPFG